MNNPQQIQADARLVNNSDRANVLLLAILALAATLRIYQLGTKSLWIDEIGQLWYAQMGILQAVQGAMTHVAAMPLDYVITSVVAALDDSPFALRLPALIWGVLAVYALYRLGNLLFSSREIGLVAAFLLAVSPPHIEYSQEIRFYSLFVLMAILSVYTFAQAVQQPSKARWIIFGATLALAILTHYYTVFVIAALALHILLSALKRQPPYFDVAQRSLLTPFVICSVCAITLGGVWYLLSGGGNASQFAFVFPINLALLAAPLTGGHLPNEILGYFIFPLLMLLGLGLGLARGQIWAATLASLVAGSFAGVLLLSWLFSYFYSPRQLLFVVPFYLLLASAGLCYTAQLALRRSRYAGFAAAALALALAASLTPQLRAYYAVPKEHWGDTAAFLRTAVSRDNSAVITAPRTLNLTKYLLYFQPSLAQHFTSEEALNSPADGAIQYERLWLVSTPAFAAQLSTDWTRVEVSKALDTFSLYYLGKVPEQQLWQELGRMALPPNLAASSQLLYVMQRQQPAVAQLLARQLATDAQGSWTQMVARDKSLLLTQAGRVLFDTGQRDEGVTLVEQALRLNPRDQEAANTLGYVYVRAQRCDEAIAVIEGSPQAQRDYWASMFLGSAYACKQEWKLGAASYRQAFVIRAIPDPLIAEAQLHVEAGDKQQAVLVLNNLLSQFPDTPAAAQARELLGQIGSTP